MQNEQVRVIVTVEPQALKRISGVARDAAAAGMTVEQTLEVVGVLTGTIARAHMNDLQAVAGISAVEVEREITLPPPESDIQ